MSNEFNIGKRLARVKNIPELYPGVFTESSIRWLIFNEKNNGFSCCVRRLGKNVLVDLDAFEAWIDKQTQNRNTRKTFSIQQVKEIKIALSSGVHYAELAKKLGKARSTIYNIKCGKNWKDI